MSLNNSLSPDNLASDALEFDMSLTTGEKLPKEKAISIAEEKKREIEQEEMSLYAVSAKFSNQIIHGKYSAAFSQVISYLSALPKEKIKSHEIEVWTSDLLTQLLEETHGFQKIVKEDKFNSFIYYLNILLAKIGKDYHWLKNCLPLSTIDYIFSNLIQHNELSMAKSFLPIITDKNFNNYPQTLQYCYENKNQDAFDFLAQNLNGISALSVDLLLEVYENFGYQKAFDFMSKYNIDACAFGLKQSDQSLLSQIFQNKDKDFLAKLLTTDPTLLERALSQHDINGENSFISLDEENALVFKDILFSVELPTKALLHLYTFSFDAEFLSQASGTDYYKKLFSQNLFESKEASRGRLEIYYDLCDMSYAQLAKTKENQTVEQTQKILTSLNQTIAVIEDFLTHYKKPIASIQGLNELTYILSLQKKLPFLVNSSLIDKVIRLRPEHIESAQHFIEEIYAPNNSNQKSTPSIQGIYGGTMGPEEKNATPHDLIDVWLKEVKEYMKTFIWAPKTLWKYYKEIKKEKKQKRLSTPVSEAYSIVGATPEKIKLDIEESIEKLQKEYESLNISEVNRAKCAHLLFVFKEIKELVFTTKHALTPEESHMLRQNLPSYISQVMELYERLNAFQSDALLEKLELQYNLLTTQLALFKTTLSQDIGQKIEQEISTHNILLSNKNVKYQSLSASK